MGSDGWVLWVRLYGVEGKWDANEMSICKWGIRESDGDVPDGGGRRLVTRRRVVAEWRVGMLEVVVMGRWR
jgi:hypothetical protein